MQQQVKFHSNLLYQGQVLNQNEYISSQNKQFHAIMQTDGNFVVYKSLDFIPENATWASKTHNKGQGPYRLVMQQDGNLVLYDMNDHCQWSSDTFDESKERALVIKMEDDGKLNLLNHQGCVVKTL